MTDLDSHMLYIMLNWRLYDNVDGNFTCISNEYFCIGRQYFSDHLPVIRKLQLHALSMGIPNSHYNENVTRRLCKYKWKDTLKTDFINKFMHLHSDFRNNLRDNQNYILDLHY